jgi:hypothetical protein
MRLPFYTTNYNDLFVNKGIPLESAKGGEQTMFPEYQDYMKTLPPNPTFEELNAEQMKQIEEQTAIIRGKGWADAPAPAPQRGRGR